MCLVREMLEGDFDAVIEIIRLHCSVDAESATDDFHRYFRLRSDERIHHGNYVAVVNGEVIGVSGFYIDREVKDIYWLNWTYVSLTYRRQGIASKLLATVESKTRALGARKLYVDTSSDPIYQDAVKFYESKGFELEGMLTDFYEDREDKLILSKRL